MTDPRHVNVFESGKDGYFAFRIPALAAAADGTLLAFAEARKHNRSDPGMNDNEIHLVQKRSTDGGRTWSPLLVIEDAGARWSAANPTAVLDRATGRVWLHSIRCRPGCSSRTARPGTDDILNLIRSSGDGGASWSEPADITPALRDMADPAWRCTVVGPGGGIQDRRGRLLVPCWRSAARSVFAAFSEDHGRTWERGEAVPGAAGGNEDQLVELADGSLLLDFRQDSGPHRWTAVSRDGGRTWSEPRPGQPVTPVCCAVERAGAGDAGPIVWTGPRGPGRATLVARVSVDEAATFPREHVIADEPAAYSDAERLADGAVGVLWERADYRFIAFTRLEPAFLA